MSFYSEHEGEIRFKKKEDYEACKKYLLDAEWATEDAWLDEMGGVMSESPFTDKLLTIEFYGVTQRNIHRFFGWFEEQKYDWEGLVVGASTDGCFEGWITTPDGQEIHDDLDEWAVQKGFDQTRPHHDDDSFLEWQYNVIEEYLSNPYIEPENSVKFITEDLPPEPKGRNPKELFKRSA